MIPSNEKIIIEIPCDLLDLEGGLGLSDVKKELIEKHEKGEELPEGVSVLTIEELLQNLNESDPLSYFVTQN